MPALHHYTSINSLACILDSKKIRFSRADTFDDPHEARVVGNKNIGLVNFATCWTLQGETLPQWYLYGDHYKGVIITIHPTPLNNNESVYFEPFTFHNHTGIGFQFVPKSAKDDHFTPLKVDYVTKDEFNCCTPANEAQTTKVLKLDHWKFQEEARFNISLVANSDRICSPSDLTRNDHFLGYPLCERTHYDHPLLETVYKNMTITAGPCCDNGDKLLIQALIDKYLPGQKLQTSSLVGLVKRKGTGT